MKINEKGFSAVEALLLIVIVAIIGVTGFFVLTAKNKTNDTLAPATQHVVHEDLRPFPIPELGIKLLLPTQLALNDANYMVAPDGQTVGLSSDPFEGAVAACRPKDTAAASFPAVIVLEKHQGKYDSAKAFDELGAYGKFGKQFNGYYISYSSPDGGYCGGDTSAAAKKVKVLFNTTRQQFVSGLQRAQEIK